MHRIFVLTVLSCPCFYLFIKGKGNCLLGVFRLLPLLFYCKAIVMGKVNTSSCFMNNNFNWKITWRRLITWYCVRTFVWLHRNPWFTNSSKLGDACDTLKVENFFSVFLHYAETHYCYGQPSMIKTLKFNLKVGALEKKENCTILTVAMSILGKRAVSTPQHR